MAAANTDLFRKQTSNFSTTLDAGISDSDTTIPLSSTTGLPTDTAITLTIDRVDANGVSTPAKMERITGVVSGTDIVDSLRGEDGSTPSAHDAGAVVEVIWEAETWNDNIDALIKQHDQYGNHKFNAPEGFLLNGKIVPSVTSNNLTVAIKTLAGTDPSATDPIYVRIGDTVRSITSALSVTKAAGTNWCNAGSAELATKEIDYFVYLGYNATDGVVIGFARIPYGTRYDSFSTTTTERNYCAISTITTAAAGDVYTVIGRFAATLSAGAGYTWTVPTFTSENLIQSPIFETRTLQWTPTYTGSGSLTFGSVNSFMGTRSGYKIVGSNLLINLFAAGTTGGTTSTTINATIPMSVGLTYQAVSAVVRDGTYTAGRGQTDNVNVVGVFKHDASNWGIGTSREITFNANIDLTK